jgi:hypothetical protein
VVCRSRSSSLHLLLSVLLHQMFNRFYVCRYSSKLYLFWCWPLLLFVDVIYSLLFQVSIVSISCFLFTYFNFSRYIIFCINYWYVPYPLNLH